MFFKKQEPQSDEKGTKRKTTKQVTFFSFIFMMPDI